MEKDQSLPQMELELPDIQRRKNEPQLLPKAIYKLCFKMGNKAKPKCKPKAKKTSKRKQDNFFLTWKYPIFIDKIQKLVAMKEKIINQTALN